jgi:glycosyltransferase involved in cell wall biosynthesis
VNRAVKILTGSEFSRDSIAKAYGVNGDNVVVVPNAAAAIFRPMRREHARAFVLSKYELAAPFLLTVGDLQPRKNHIRLIQAFADLVGSNPSIPHHLVLAGKETWFASRVLEAARQSGVADRIRFAGFVSDDDLLRLYNACDVFVFPSLYEGFGLPILEAMACGRAVACSNSSAMLEVANGAAILFDPESRSEMAHAMSDLIVDGELRARMERLGLQRSSQFSWQRTAERTLEVYREVAMRARPSRRATAAMAAARR